jgi:23S rRNA pseudouridine1911/1915/1917 synthase
VHLAAIGHPVVGDARYRGDRRRSGCARPFLHATGLAFLDPATDEEVAFSSPLPDDLAAVLAQFV